MELKRHRSSDYSATGNEGYFPPDSMIRQITSEAVVLLGGGYAILMQLAHPFIAAGVDDHSSYQSDILARLYRTVYFVHSMVCDDKKTVHDNLAQFHAGHRKIRGRLGHRAGNFSPDIQYSGTDPEAKLWVHATIVDAVLKAYEHFYGPLNSSKRQRFYTDTILLARLLEIPEEIIPPTVDRFHTYMNEMTTGDTLAVTDTARRLGRSVLYPKVGIMPSISAWLLRLMTAELLAERFRSAYGLRSDSLNRVLLNGLVNTVRLLRPVAPEWIWQSPLHNGKLANFLLFS